MRSPVSFVHACLAYSASSIGSSSASRACCFSSMPVVIETIHCLRFDDSPEWRVSNDLLRNVGDDVFIKLVAYDMGFIRLVCNGVCELPKKRYKLTLAQCDGYKSLLKLRQDKVEDLIRQESGHGAQSSGRHALGLSSGTAPLSKKRRQPKFNASQLQELRDKPQVIEFDLPGVGGMAPIAISCLRSCHPFEQLTVKFDADTIEQVVLHIRAFGTTEEALTKRRSYRDESAPSGAWKWGSAGFVMRRKGEEGQKYRSLNNLESSPSASPSDSPAAPIADARSADDARSDASSGSSPRRLLAADRQGEDG